MNDRGQPDTITVPLCTNSPLIGTWLVSARGAPKSPPDFTLQNTQCPPTANDNVVASWALSRARMQREGRGSLPT